ncbi:MAG: hypothetical protein V4805_02930 [Pseudomonadota bacterium]
MPNSKDPTPATHSEPAAPDPTGDDEGTPKFGRLLIVLILAVMLIGVITVATEAYYS